MSDYNPQIILPNFAQSLTLFKWNQADIILWKLKETSKYSADFDRSIQDRQIITPHAFTESIKILNWWLKIQNRRTFLLCSIMYLTWTVLKKMFFRRLGSQFSTIFLMVLTVQYWHMGKQAQEKRIQCKAMTLLKSIVEA